MRRRRRNRKGSVEEMDDESFESPNIKFKSLGKNRRLRKRRNKNELLDDYEDSNSPENKFLPKRTKKLINRKSIKN